MPNGSDDRVQSPFVPAHKPRMSTARPLLPAAPVAGPVRRPTAGPPGTPREAAGGLTAAEWRRRALHMLPGCLPAILWVVPHRVPLSPTLRGILLLVIALLGAWVWREWRAIRRGGESVAARGPAVFGYAGGVAGTLLLFPDRPECGFAVLAVLAFGDGSATLFGKLALASGGRSGDGPAGPARRLPWNPAKTWAGLGAFLTFGTLAAALLYRGETLNPEAARAAATWPAALLVGACGTIPAAVLESLGGRWTGWNDNIRVAVAAAAGVLLAHAAIT